MKAIEIKETDEGIILDMWNNDNLIITKTYWFSDLKEQYREYLKDVSDDDNFDITTVEDWNTWFEEEKQRLKEQLEELNFETISKKDYDDWTEDEINVMTKENGCCSECGFIIDVEDYITRFEDRGEFWGAPCKECITTGYICKNCGNKVEF